MAKKTRAQTNGKSYEYAFINYRLSKQDIDELGTMDVEAEFPLNSIFALAEQGYKFSLNLDAKNNSYVASLADQDPHSDFNKHILTGRGATALDAFYALMYRHFYAAQQDWANIAVQDKVDNRRFW